MHLIKSIAQTRQQLSKEVQHIAIFVVTIEEVYFGLAWQANSRQLALYAMATGGFRSESL